MLKKLRGMFAFAIWDAMHSRLFLARDPYGIKPLYVATTGREILFASQVKALLATGLVSHEPDQAGREGFYLLGSVPEPRTWYRDIRSVRAGSWELIEGSRVVAAETWLDIADAWRCAGGGESDEGVKANVRDALRRSVSAHLVADVPVGIFLSGGIDSSAIAGLMVDCGATRIHGVTVRFAEFSGRPEDEAPVAAQVAKHYGINHHIRTVSRDEFMADLPVIMASMDQPSVDGINTWYAAKASKELGLKAVMSGVGGDELFQGYSSFSRLPRLMAARRLASRVPGAVPLARLYCRWRARSTGNGRWSDVPDFLRTIEGSWLMYRGLFGTGEVSQFISEPTIARSKDSVLDMVRAMHGRLPSDSRLALSQIESTTYLRNQLLRDSDWASMHHSLELRTPLVDAFLLGELTPVLSDLCRFPGKTLLATAPRTPLPPAVIHRRKTGFGIPVHRWLVQSGTLPSSESASRAWARELTRAIYA
jgi:asparagine synthase (glutamine-hydrolysing)